jgi:hypothetical protein
MKSTVYLQKPKVVLCPMCGERDFTVHAYRTVFPKGIHEVHEPSEIWFCENCGAAIYLEYNMQWSKFKDLGEETKKYAKKAMNKMTSKW